MLRQVAGVWTPDPWAVGVSIGGFPGRRTANRTLHIWCGLRTVAGRVNGVPQLLRGGPGCRYRVRVAGRRPNRGSLTAHVILPLIYSHTIPSTSDGSFASGSAYV